VSADPPQFIADFESWGRIPKATHSWRRVDWTDVDLKPANGTKMLPHGQGRSYGDCCLNDHGLLLLTGGMNRFISFDKENGILRCEGGTTLAQVLQLIIPAGWFLPVSPGTKFVSIGGAIANDIHGKNHHKAGTFGNFVNQFELLRSDNTRIVCSPTQNPEMFAATIGGLGLTGLILWAEIRLRRINNPFIQMDSFVMSNLDDFFRLTEESDADYEYTMSWIDCLASGQSLGRGIFMRGNHAEPDRTLPPIPAEHKLSIPFDVPGKLLNSWSVKVFNWFYYHLQMDKPKTEIVYYEPFFYPLDAVLHWNRLYGKPGFYQYQFVVPHEKSATALRRILTLIADSRTASFLAVLKIFGNTPSPGLLSFPKPGVTLALDLPNRGQKSLDLFNKLDDIVAASGGAVYPAKDARMSAESFQQYFPQWQKLCDYIDPRFSSGFWRRVTGNK